MRRRRWRCRRCGVKAWAPGDKPVTENERLGLCRQCREKIASASDRLLQIAGLKERLAQ